MPVPAVSNRKFRSTARAQKGNHRHTRDAALTGVALTAIALTAAIAPSAAPTNTHNLDVALAASLQPIPCADGSDKNCYLNATYGVGPLAGALPWVLDVAGMNPIPLEYFQIGYDFVGNAAFTKQLYDQLNSLGYIPTAEIEAASSASGGIFKTCKSATGQSGCRTQFIVGTGIGTLGVTDTIHALIESAQNNTRARFDPLAVDAGGTGLTNVSALYINNMLRPDGGLAARFPDIMKFFGLNPTMPSLGYSGPNDTGSSVYNWTTDVTWAYNTFADFPVTANPFSLANSLFAVIPPPRIIQQLLSGEPLLDTAQAILESAGGTLQASDGFLINASPGDQILDNSNAYAQPFIGALLSSAPAGPLPGLPVDGSYTVLEASQIHYPDAQKRAAAALPLTYPMYVASALINPLLKMVNSPYLLGTPEADVLTRALTILVNIGYNDIVTPEMLTTEPPNGVGKTYEQMLFQAWDRSFYQLTPDKPTPFSWFNNPAMTNEQTSAAVGAAWDAFTEDLKAQTEKPLWGILVPNPDVPPTPTTPASTGSIAVQPVSAAPAAAIAAGEPAPVSETPVTDSEPVEADALAADIAVVADEPAAPPADTGNSAAASNDSGRSVGQGAEDNATSRHARGGRGSS